MSATDRFVDFEAHVSMPIVPQSTSESLTPEQARQVGAALQRQAQAYFAAASEAERAAMDVSSLGYKPMPRVRQKGQPYNRIWSELLVRVSGVEREREEAAS